MGNAYRCDACGATVKEHKAVSLLEVRLVGVDISTYDSPLVTGCFCSADCVSAHFNTILANRNRMGVQVR